MTIEELVDKITTWEGNAGESFNDYFTHDNVRDGSWAFWLLGKGYTDHALAIIAELAEGKTCIDQGLLYDIYPIYNEDNTEFYEESYVKNITILSEFLLSTQYYTELVTAWLKENSQDDTEE